MKRKTTDWSFLDEKAIEDWFAKQKWSVGNIPSWNMEEAIKRAFRCGIRHERGSGQLPIYGAANKCK